MILGALYQGKCHNARNVFTIRLKEKVNLKFLEETVVTPKYLNDNIITEVVVSSLTTMDNCMSLPVATHYVTKKQKMGADVKKFLYSPTKAVQICHQCQGQMKCSDHILSEENVCLKTCDECLAIESVCNECSLRGQTSHILSLRACNNCIILEKKYKQSIVLVITADCEEGNKKAFEMIKAEIDNGNVPPDFLLLTPILDIPHVGKSVKASYSNWFLKIGTERGNLSMIRNLRNRSTPDIQSKMRSFIPKNDHVRNRDRQNPEAVFTLTRKPLLDYLQTLKMISSTMIPETCRGTIDNLPGMYQKPIAVEVGPYGWIYVLFDLDSNLGTKLLKARLHSPVDKFSVVEKDVKATEIHYSSRLLYMCGTKRIFPGLM